MAVAVTWFVLVRLAVNVHVFGVWLVVTLCMDGRGRLEIACCHSLRWRVERRHMVWSDCGLDVALRFQVKSD